jgi:hypothetical protein
VGTNGGVIRRRLTEPNDGLIRRAWKTPAKKYGPITDQLTGTLRAPAAAFEPRFADPTKPDKKVDDALSVNVETSLVAAKLPLAWGVDPSKQYAARITVGVCLASELEAFHEPVPGNPHHGSIWGLIEMYAIDREKYERTIDVLAKASTIVPNTIE